MKPGRLGVEASRLPVLVRFGLLGACTLLAVAGASLSPQEPVAQALLPGLILLLISLAGTLPVPPSIPRWLQPMAEGFVAAVVLGALHERGAPYLPYLLVPVLVAGLESRLRYALGTAALATVGLVGATAASEPAAQIRDEITNTLRWGALLVALAVSAASIRRVRESGAPAAEPAYREAHRLLTELHAISRQLSLGLDPRTLAVALVDEMRETTAIRRASLAQRTDAGLFVPLAGEELSPEGERAARLAWEASAATERVADGAIRALAVRMGDRPVAVVVLELDPDAGGEPLHAIQAAVARAGPRLASALLFDDVRRLATVDERNRVAREIHDGIAQDLASLAYLVDDIERDAGPDLAPRLSRLGEHVRTMVSDLRLRIFDLRAGVSDSVTLGAAVSEYLTRVGTQTGLEVQLGLTESTHRLPTSVEVGLLRIVQEAVANVRRHAQARILSVTLAVDPPRARLTIADDGRGLQSGRPDSMGLTGMRERARRIGAALSIDTPATGGTRIEVRLDAGRSALPTPMSGIPMGGIVREAFR